MDITLTRATRVSLVLGGILLCLVSLLGNTPARSQAAEGDTLFLPVGMQESPAEEGVIAYINRYRAQTGLPPTFANPIYQRGATLHSRYIVKSDQATHEEDPASEWYTPEGDAAGRGALITAAYNVDYSYREAIDRLMKTPFHRLGLLDPQLTDGLAVGVWQEADGAVQAAYTVRLAPIRVDLATSPTGYPQMWPSQGTVLPAHMASFDGSELPDPLASCPGYVGPVGLPITMSLDEGWPTPGPVDITAHRLVHEDGTALAHCLFDRLTYASPDPNETHWGRSTLESANTVVLIPRQPLEPGQSYTVSITVNGRTHTWTFYIAAD